jgi:hypothetical protein
MVSTRTESAGPDVRQAGRDRFPSAERPALSLFRAVVLPDQDKGPTSDGEEQSEAFGYLASNGPEDSSTTAGGDRSSGDDPEAGSRRPSDSRSGAGERVEGDIKPEEGSRGTARSIRHSFHHNRSRAVFGAPRRALAERDLSLKANLSLDGGTDALRTLVGE